MARSPFSELDPVIRVSMVVTLGFDRLQRHRQPPVVHYDR